MEESEQDLIQTQSEVEKLKVLLEKEQILSENLELEVNMNNEEVQRLDEEFRKYKGDLDKMNQEYESKLRELEGIRQRANEDIRRLSTELGTAQSEVNVLILESQKYES